MNRPVHVIVMRRFDIAAERVFDACLDPAWLGGWMLDPKARGEAVVSRAPEARVGGRFSFTVDRAGLAVEHGGEYLEIDRPQLLVFAWTTRDGLADASRVIIEIAPCDSGCEVKLTQVMGPNWSAEVDRAASVWSGRLDALERTIVQDREAQRA